MTQPLIQKTFKMEIEFTVSMDGIAGADPAADAAGDLSTSLQTLQRALVEHEPVLRQQMLAAVFNKLQEYSDYLAAQDSLTPLMALAAGLDTQDQDAFGTTRADFLDATRTLRTASLTARVSDCSIQEQVTCAGDCPTWQPAWTDLRPHSDLGHMLEALCVPVAPSRSIYSRVPQHYLQVRYLTRQPDGIHAQGACTCGKIFDGLGEDGSQALETVWTSYQAHLEVYQIGERTQLALANPSLKNKS
ncbi:MAG TPA: hypothetical protein VGJ97_07965 [Anaerolineaceae bacterium]|jgi:hypothetical protein